MPRKRKSTQDGYNLPFPTNLRAIMAETDTTQEMLAQALGFSARQSIGAYTDGRASPNWQTLASIADYFNVSADWLMGRTEARRLSVDLQSACAYTGLSDKSVEAIRLLTSDGCTKQETEKLISLIVDVLKNYVMTEATMKPDFETFCQRYGISDYDPDEQDLMTDRMVARISRVLFSMASRNFEYLAPMLFGTADTKEEE